MKALGLATIVLVLLGAGPALAMSCCGGGNGKAAMCAKGSVAVNAKAKKGGCCCEGMSGNMTKRG